VVLAWACASCRGVAPSVIISIALPSVAGGDLFTWEPSTGEPTKVEGLENKGVKSIAAGSYHMAAVTNDGQLYTWYDSQLARCEILFY
jgi:alpha-tubulin suppressor-like RCC1 family protein